MSRRAGPLAEISGSGSVRLLIRQLTHLWDRSYLNISIPPVFHFRKVHPINAVVNIVCCHPLIGIVSTLCRYTRDLHRPSEINLQPLVVVIMARGPRTDIRSTARTIQAREPGSVVFVIYRGGGYLAVFYSAWLHTHGGVTEVFWIKESQPCHNQQSANQSFLYSSIQLFVYSMYHPFFPSFR